MTQMTRDQIDRAEAAGILSAKQAKAMRTELSAAKPLAKVDPVTPQIGNEDDLRFLRSFGDVFIGVGLILLALGASAITRFVFGGGSAYLLAALGAYGLAEYFGRRRRAHFPTLITALAFLIFVQRGLDAFGALGGLGGLGAALITVVAMTLFYFRIRLPFCIALIAISLLYLFFAFLAQVAPDLLRNQFGGVLMLSGGMIFTAALLYDRQDLHRRTRFADNAFWLHLLAAPLLIHGFVGYAIMDRTEFLYEIIPVLDISRSDAVLVLIATGVITIVGLAINRRALIVSALGYTALAIGWLVKETRLDWGTTLSLTLLLLGAAVVLLGVAWHPLRNQLIKVLPKWKVFPPPYEEA